MYIIRLRPFLVWIGIALALGLVSGGIALGGLDFYTSLHLPAGSPPAALFPAAWAVFPLLLGVSAYFLWAGDPRQKKHSLFLIAAQFAARFLGPVFFFRCEWIFLSLLWLALVWIVTAALISSALHTSRIAAYLQIPYLLWITYLGYVNCCIFLGN